MNNKIILALDTADLNFAINTTKKIKDKIFTVKLGLEFFNAHGKNGVKKFNEIGIDNLMLDLKLNDIPETVYKSIKALDDIKFGFLTIHGQGGKKMIEQAKKAAGEIKSKPKIFWGISHRASLVNPTQTYTSAISYRGSLVNPSQKYFLEVFYFQYLLSLRYNDQR